MTWAFCNVDAGDPKVVPPDGVRDVVWSLSAPFRSAPTFVCSLKFRFKELRFAPPELSLALVTEKWVKTRQSTTWLVQFGDDGKAPKVRSGQALWFVHCLTDSFHVDVVSMDRIV